MRLFEQERSSKILHEIDRFIVRVLVISVGGPDFIVTCNPVDEIQCQPSDICEVFALKR
jgi:hypothetical protein